MPPPPPPQPANGSSAQSPPGEGGPYNGRPAMGGPAPPAGPIQALSAANEQTWLLMGAVAEQFSDFDRALAAYEHALRHNPGSVSALTQVAGIARAKEDFPKAIEFFQRVLNITQDNGEIWGALGHCYLMMDDLQKAYTAYQQALYHLPNPKEPKLWYGIGILYDRYGSLEHAEEAFSSVLRMEPTFDKANEIYFRLGIIYKQQHKYSSSLDCFKFILKNPPRPLTEIDIWFQVGHVHEQQKEFVPAKEAYERVLQENPEHSKVLQQLGWLYHQREAPFANQELAISYLTKSLESDGTDAQSWYLLGRAFMAGQRYNKAYEAYQQAVYRDGRNPTFWCSIGVLYFQINQFRDALDAYSRAIRLNPYISEVWFDLGSLYESCNNQIADAIDAYGRALDLDPQNATIKTRLSLLRNLQQNGGPAPTPPVPRDVHPTAYASSGPPNQLGGQPGQQGPPGPQPSPPFASGPPSHMLDPHQHPKGPAPPPMSTGGPSHPYHPSSSSIPPPHGRGSPPPGPGYRGPPLPSTSAVEDPRGRIGLAPMDVDRGGPPAPAPSYLPQGGPSSSQGARASAPRSYDNARGPGQPPHESPRSRHPESYPPPPPPPAAGQHPAYNNPYPPYIQGNPGPPPHAYGLERGPPGSRDMDWDRSTGGRADKPQSNGGPGYGPHGGRSPFEPRRGSDESNPAPGPDGDRREPGGPSYAHGQPHPYYQQPGQHPTHDSQRPRSSGRGGPSSQSSAKRYGPNESDDERASAANGGGPPSAKKKRTGVPSSSKAEDKHRRKAPKPTVLPGHTSSKDRKPLIGGRPPGHGQSPPSSRSTWAQDGSPAPSEGSVSTPASAAPPPPATNVSRFADDNYDDDGDDGVSSDAGGAADLLMGLAGGFSFERGPPPAPATSTSAAPVPPPLPKTSSAGSNGTSSSFPTASTAPPLFPMPSPSANLPVQTSIRSTSAQPPALASAPGQTLAPAPGPPRAPSAPAASTEQVGPPTSESNLLKRPAAEAGGAMTGVEEPSKKQRVEDSPAATDPIQTSQGPAVVKREPSPALAEPVASTPAPSVIEANVTPHPAESTIAADKEPVPAPNPVEETTTSTNAVSANGKEPSPQAALGVGASSEPPVVVKGEPAGGDVEMRDGSAEKTVEAAAAAVPAGPEENGKE